MTLMPITKAKVVILSRMLSNTKQLTRLSIVRREQPGEEGVALLLGELGGRGGVGEHRDVEGLEDGGDLLGHGAVRGSHHSCNKSLPSWFACTR